MLLKGHLRHKTMVRLVITQMPVAPTTTSPSTSPRILDPPTPPVLAVEAQLEDLEREHWGWTHARPIRKRLNLCWARSSETFKTLNCTRRFDKMKRWRNTSSLRIRGNSEESTLKNARSSYLRMMKNLLKIIHPDRDHKTELQDLWWKTMTMFLTSIPQRPLSNKKYKFRPKMNTWTSCKTRMEDSWPREKCLRNSTTKVNRTLLRLWMIPRCRKLWTRMKLLIIFARSSRSNRSSNYSSRCPVWCKSPPSYRLRIKIARSKLMFPRYSFRIQKQELELWLRPRARWWRKRRAAQMLFWVISRPFQFLTTVWRAQCLAMCFHTIISTSKFNSLLDTTVHSIM